MKEFYRTWSGCLVDQIWPLNEKLAEVIKGYNPKSVLEFGCSVAKHAKLLPGIDYFGIDVNPQAVRIARFAGHTVLEGDEYSLGEANHWANRFDVAFTCSVLNHMPEIDYAVKHLKRIATKAVVIAETRDVPDDEIDKWRYFPHDYEALGFKKLDYVWESFHRLQQYCIYVIEK